MVRLLRKANMSGDFFIIGDMDVVMLSKLKNVEFTRHAVEKALDGVVCEHVIMNLKKEQFINLIFD